MNIEAAKEVLENLEAQKKEAQERLNVLIGAVQGAQFVIKALEQQTPPEKEQKATSKKKVA